MIFKFGTFYVLKMINTFAMVFWQLTGVAFSAAKRLQFNMEMKPIPEIEIMKTMPDMPFPLFWLEESVVITKKDATLMKYTLFL